MLAFIVVFGLVYIAGLGAILLVLVYPVSKKARLALSDLYIKTMVPMVFKAFNVYVHFRTLRYKDHKDKLPEHCMIIANHQSLLDIILFMYFFPGKALRFVAKEELGKAPLIGQILRAQEHALIPRSGQPARTMKLLDAFSGRVIARGQIPVLFPEGHRSRDGSVGTFYAAGFRRLMKDHPLPVAVCALDGGYRIATLDGIFRNLRNGYYRIKILKIYPAPPSKEAQMHILEEGKALIQAQLDEWRANDGYCIR